jgi:hypothetical protein
MKRVTVCKVNKLRTPEQRATVCYCGRGFAGWKESPYGNYQRLDCPDEFLAALLVRPDLEAHLQQLWLDCDQGERQLGCWCVNWDGVGELPSCHAAVYASLLNERYFPEKGE